MSKPRESSVSRYNICCPTVETFVEHQCVFGANNFSYWVEPIITNRNTPTFDHPFQPPLGHPEPLPHMGRGRPG
jgi:hypothetical protein